MDVVASTASIATKCLTLRRPSRPCRSRPRLPAASRRPRPPHRRCRRRRPPSRRSPLTPPITLARPTTSSSPARRRRLPRLRRRRLRLRRLRRCRHRARRAYVLRTTSSALSTQKARRTASVSRPTAHSTILRSFDGWRARVLCSRLKGGVMGREGCRGCGEQGRPPSRHTV